MMRYILNKQSFIFLNESLSSAREKYLDTGILTKTAFRLTVESDPSKTKKYLEQMCEWIVKRVAADWEIDEDILAYHNLCTKKLIDAKYRDIKYFKSSWKEFSEFVEENKNNKSATEKKKSIKKGSAETAFENDKYVVMVPKSYEASCMYGSDTKWCTTSNNGYNTSQHWDSYAQKGVKLYYIINKKETRASDPRYHKLAVAVHPDGKKECFDSWDNYDEKHVYRNFSFEDVLDMTGLSPDIFQPKEFTDTELLDSIVRGKWTEKDGKINVDGDVYINLTLPNKRLPGNFGKVSGVFSVEKRGILESLEGCPEEVGKDFNINYQKIKSGNLVGGPKKVGGEYSCFNAGLTSLEGAPEEINGHFECGYNKFYDLTGAPKKVKKGFACDGSELNSLVGCPEEIGLTLSVGRNNLEDFKGLSPKITSINISENKFKSLDGCPKELKNFTCSQNRLTSLKGGPEIVTDVFYCNINRLKNLIGGPTGVVKLYYCAYNNLESLEGAPEEVIEFNCRNNELESLDFLPKKIKRLVISQNSKDFTEEEIMAVCKINKYDIEN